MATEHPGMGAYNPDPGEAGSSHPTEDSEHTERMNLPGTPSPGSSAPKPTLPLPGLPIPTAAIPAPGSTGPMPDPDDSDQTVTMPGPGGWSPPTAAGSGGSGPPSAMPSLGDSDPTVAMPGPGGWGPPGAAGSGGSDPSATSPQFGVPDETKTSPQPGLDIGGAVYPPQGRIERQEPGVTQPRPPTVAEARARDKARKRAEEAEHAAVVALADRERKRKRVLIGGAAIVGVAAVIGAGYLACQAAEPDVTAYCTTDDNGQQTVVDDNDCVRAQNYATSTGAYHSGLPAVFFFNGHQYRYYYGGTNTVGRAPVGGSFSAPSNAHVSTKSGTVIRGGLGSKSGGKSGGS